MPRILYLGPPSGLAGVRDVVGPEADVVHPDPDRPAVLAALDGVTAVVDASMKVRWDGELLAGAPDLRVISCATTGSDHIDRVATEAAGVSVRTLREDPEVLHDLTPAAELTWALVLACARRLPAANAHVLGGGWDRDLFPGTMLRGRRYGIVGCGRIGQWVARYATAFGMEVVGYDPHADPWPDGIERVTLDAAVTTVDVVSVHVHLSEETTDLVDRSLLERVRPGAIVVNTSRGGVLDEAALLDGLRDGRIGAAGLDVLQGEPDVADHPLVVHARTHDNVVLSPHCGGNSPDAVRIVSRRATEKVVADPGRP